VNLLDTQLVLWAALLPERLKPRTRRMIEDRDQVVAFSHVTVGDGHQIVFGAHRLQS
jgi:PIN domain nuclease of toxin-antitoxin system